MTKQWVCLLHHSSGALLEKLADLSDAIAIMQDELAAARGEETFEDLSQSTLENWLGASRETVPS